MVYLVESCEDVCGAYAHVGDGCSFCVLVKYLLRPLFVVFYFFMIRPQQKKQKEVRKMLDSVQRGDKVITASGIHGSVADVDEEGKTVTLNVSDNTKIKFDKAAIAVVLNKKD